MLPDAEPANVVDQDKVFFGGQGQAVAKAEAVHQDLDGLGGHVVTHQAAGAVGQALVEPIVVAVPEINAVPTCVTGNLSTNKCHWVGTIVTTKYADALSA